jgi:oligosaccharide repeat unit polymerase
MLWPVIQLLFVYHSLKRKLSLSRVAVAGFLGFIISVLVGISRANLSGIQQTYFERFLADIRVYMLNNAFIIPHFYPGRLLMGFSFVQNIRLLLPGHQLDFGTWLKEEVFGMSFKGGGIGTSIIAESLINFGVVGLVGELFLVGFIFSFAYKIYKQKPSPVTTMLYLIFLYRLTQVIQNGISYQVVPILFLLSLLTVLSVFFVSSRVTQQRTGR